MSFPKIHFGVYKIPQADTAKLVEAALKTGYRGIDTARWYANETEAGEGITNFLTSNTNIQRSDVFYTTKVFPSDFGYDNVKSAVKESLERVKSLGYIDLYLLHSSEGGPEVRADSWQALIDCKREGLVKHIGVSNWGVNHLEQLVARKLETPYVNQIELNPWLQHRDIVEYCKKNHIIVEAWSPLTRGLRLEDPELLVLSKKYNKSPAQILIRWSYQYGAIPVPKTATASRLQPNLEALDFELSEEDFHSLGDPNEYYVSQPLWDPTVLD